MPIYRTPFIARLLSATYSRCSIMSHCRRLHRVSCSSRTRSSAWRSCCAKDPRSGRRADRFRVSAARLHALRRASNRAVRRRRSRRTAGSRRRLAEAFGVANTIRSSRRTRSNRGPRARDRCRDGCGCRGSRRRRLFPANGGSCGSDCAACAASRIPAASTTKRGVSRTASMAAAASASVADVAAEDRLELGSRASCTCASRIEAVSLEQSGHRARVAHRRRRVDHRRRLGVVSHDGNRSPDGDLRSAPDDRGHRRRRASVEDSRGCGRGDSRSPVRDCRPVVCRSWR